MHTGTIKSYADKTGYGFIGITPELKRELGIPWDRDLFFHASAVAGQGYVKLQLQAGDTVSFETRAGRRGPEAHNVKVIHRQQPASA